MPLFYLYSLCRFQVNNGGTCLLYNTVGRMAGVGPKTLLLDVCCGTGTIGITLAKQVRGLGVCSTV
jgi:tRNA (uracil-5-)-methyltransferase